MLNVIFDVGSFDQTYVYGMIAAAVVLAGGSALGSLAARAGLPRTLGYLVTGIIIGPMAFALVSQKQLSDLRGVTDMMIGIFAFEIGTELYIGKLKSKKNPIVLIALIQNLATFFLVMLVFSMFVSIEAAILIGAVASATSPIPIVVQHRN